MTRTSKPSRIDALLESREQVKPCVVCRWKSTAGHADIREFVEKRAASGLLSGETVLLPLLRKSHGATFSVSSLRKHMKECVG